MPFDKLSGIPITSTLTKEKFAEVLDKPKLKQKMVDAFAAANGEVDLDDIFDD